MRRSTRAVCTIGASGVLALGGVATGVAPASAAGNGSMGVYQVEVSFNSNGPSATPDQTGGYWGWWDFDSAANNPQSGDGGDGQAEGCWHGQFGNGAAHSSFKFSSWAVNTDPSNSNGGLPTFFASGTEIDTYKGQTQTTPFTDQDTGILAMTAHRPILQLFGVPTPPGTSINVQVSWKPAH